MDFLLLLSALLSALTGAAAGTRAPAVETRQVGRVMAAADVVRAVVTPARRAPGQVFDLVAARLMPAVLVRLTFNEIPTFANRRRE